MTHLRQIMLEELQRRNYSESTQPASPRCCLSAVQAAAAASSRSSFLTPDGRLADFGEFGVRRRLSLLFAPSLVFLLCGALPFPEVPTRHRAGRRRIR